MSSLNSNQIKTLEKELLALQQDIKHTLQTDESAAATVELDQNRVGRLSRMDALQTQAIAQATQAQHRAQLEKIYDALKAIETGDYGYCEECGKSIPFERLSVKPESTCCVKCQEKTEN